MGATFNYHTHLYHPKFGMKDVRSQAQHQDLLRADKLWRDTPYSDEEKIKLKIDPEKQPNGLVKPVKPKRNDYKDAEKFKEAMANFERDNGVYTRAKEQADAAKAAE